MFTDCPACSRMFRVNAAHLSAAQGQVKCGYCGTQFNALERLHDTPLQPERSVKTFIDEPEPGDLEPQFDIPEDHPDHVIEETTAADESHDEKSAQTHKAAEPPGPAPKQPPGDYEKTQDFHVHISKDTIMLDEDLVPEAFMEESGPGLIARLFWSLGTAGLILISISMLIWFQRDLVLSRYPQLIPWADRLCQRLDCNVIRFRDVPAIELINRDVRDHPRYENALLVNATMINRSHIRQPFPDIQLSLYDTNGVLIAHRIFIPDDYLDDSIDILPGMAPDNPVHFVLEVTGPTEGAVSFEFKFL